MVKKTVKKTTKKATKKIIPSTFNADIGADKTTPFKDNPFMPGGPMMPSSMIKKTPEKVVVKPPIKPSKKTSNTKITKKN